jgi:hypothetical protein
MGVMDAAEETIALDPEISLRDGGVQYRSRIKFRPAAKANDTLRRQLGIPAVQLIGDDHAAEWSSTRIVLEKGTAWALDDELAILEVTYSGPHQDVKMRHDAMIPAHVRDLRTRDGFAEVVPLRDFPATEPVRRDN